MCLTQVACPYCTALQQARTMMMPKSGQVAFQILPLWQNCCGIPSRDTWKISWQAPVARYRYIPPGVLTGRTLGITRSLEFVRVTNILTRKFLNLNSREIPGCLSTDHWQNPRNRHQVLVVPTTKEKLSSRHRHCMKTSAVETTPTNICDGLRKKGHLPCE